MKDFQKEFIDFLIENKVLTFGSFKLKSGRVSPYFFNMGLVSSGSMLSKLGYYFAHAIKDSDIKYDVLFGPAYKGIPLVSTTVVALADKFGIDSQYAFNRKEAKDHGEGGNIVGSKLKGNIFVVDDVITAGTAIRESVEIIKANGANFAGVIIALDRQERGKEGALSAIQEVEKEFSVPVVSIVKLEHVLEYLEQVGGYDVYIPQIKEYRQQYGSC